MLKDGEEPDIQDEENILEDLTLIAIVGIRDHVNPKIKKYIDISRKAGIDLVMLTGESGPTAQAFAKKYGIIKSKDDISISGTEFFK